MIQWPPTQNTKPPQRVLLPSLPFLPQPPIHPPPPPEPSRSVWASRLFYRAGDCVVASGHEAHASEPPQRAPNYVSPAPGHVPSPPPPPPPARPPAKCRPQHASTQCLQPQPLASLLLLFLTSRKMKGSQPLSSLATSTGLPSAADPLSHSLHLYALRSR